MPMPVTFTSLSSGGNPVSNQSSPVTNLLGDTRVVEASGKWTEANRLGQMFTGSTAVGGVNIPINTSTTQQFVVFNPTGSGKAAILKSTYLGYVSGTPVVGAFCYVVQNIGTSSVAAPTGTASTIVNNKTMATTGSALSVLTAATVVAGTLFRPWISVFTTTAGNTPVMYKDDIDGAIALMPGEWIAVAANVAAFGTHIVSMEWQEIPVAQYT